MSQTTLELEKLTCPSCMQKITETIRELNGVEKIKIIFHSSKARVIYDETQITEDDIIQTIIDLGYEATPANK